MLNHAQEAWCREHHAEAIALLRTLGRIPAPSHHEEKRAEFVRNWLEAQGAENVYIDAALNVVLPIGVRDNAPVCVLTAHTDVVFPDTDALPLTEDDARIYAPGIGDNTANLVNLLMAAKYVLAHGMTPAQGVLIVANSCEEGLGNLKGSMQLLRDYDGRVQEMISIDGDMDAIVNRSVGSHRMRVTVHARGGHSYHKFGSPNAIAQMAELICELYRKQPPAKAKTTYNVGVIEGGTTINTISDRCSMLYEFRSEDRACLAEMQDYFDSVIAAFRARGVRVDVEIIGVRPCAGDVDPVRQSALTKRMRQIMECHSGNRIIEKAGSTDANSALAQGIPAVTIGAAAGGGAHTRGEWTEKAAMLAGQKIALDALLQYFVQ